MATRKLVMNFLYRMKSNTPAPAGCGTTEEWFKFYKLDREDETYVPFSGDSDLAKLQSGDILWFVMDNFVVARVPVLRLVEDPFNARMEIWYDGPSVKVLPRLECTVPDPLLHLSDETAAQWLASAPD
jgi:hypothetical protein